MLTYHKSYADTCLRKKTLLMDLVLNEHQRQADKFGRQTHSLSTWLTILAEEQGELAHAVNEFRLTKSSTNQHLVEIKKEAIQVATIALKIADMMLVEQEKR